MNLSSGITSSAVVDWHAPAVRDLARHLGDGSQRQVAERCFLWVRDRVSHSFDAAAAGPIPTDSWADATAIAADTTSATWPVTCAASEVLERRTGICFAKSHLLAALLRANGIPAAFGYQRLSLNDDGPPFVLHGFVWLRLAGRRWHPLDPRGNRPGVTTRFDLEAASLAYTPRLPGERTDPAVYPEPLPAVVAVLRRCRTLPELRSTLPDVEP
ncbi:transglutaminase-like domain-containing protein [Synechococcus sp. CBW1107]|uniref:transglutaminase-like domain-containing protein n=1 Tax=Synechococcus sp. CBW1107 TaxID=2789857 RepID=UPI0018CC9AD9|nr:transglutaminase family protein [Synechococcus sp. CBW1107]